jgi:hypothetical protein
VTAQVRDTNVLPPPEPRDPKGVRPSLDLPGMKWQVDEIQRRLKEEKKGKRGEKE